MARHISLAGALSAALLLTACGGAEPSAPAPVRAPAAGRLTLAYSTVADVKPVSATLTTRDMGEARSRISGILVSLLVKEGDMVRRGQVIATVKDDRLAMVTAAYDAQVAAAAADAARAQGDLSRTRTLFNQGIYAQARMDQVEAVAKAANATLAAARAQRAASAELGAQGAILAPASGRVLTADVPLGSVVMAGQSVARITAGPTVVRIELPEGQARALRVGDEVQLAAEDLRGVATIGRVTQIYPSVTAGQIVADVTAPGLPEDLVGQRVRVGVRIGQRQALVVPRRYVSTRYGIDYVRLVSKDGSASETPVQTTATATGAEVEILSGVRPGDVLVPAGANP
ncbi:MAG: efflux RND transporter periplasmic adaptor subunit [Caulobacterales bacterium]|nr:efflux RND transporter periplasmic adaptor subunit [Caulobacterales bacterium]